MENLLLSWQKFRKGKRSKSDVIGFERNLEDNLFELHYSLKDKTYKHGNYQKFNVHDPKFRIIHKANVRDRIVHHAIYRVLYSIFDKSFIYDSYSCRFGKGTHKTVKRLAKFARKVSKNHTQKCFALKCDIKKFFDSVDHEILFNLIQKKTQDQDTLYLIKEIIESFSNAKIAWGGGLIGKESLLAI